MPGQILIVNPRGGKPRKVQIMAASKPTKKRKLYGAAAAAHAKKAAHRGDTKKRSKARKSTSVASLRGLFHRNPKLPSARGLIGNVMGQAMAGGLGAIGGAAVDLAMRPLPVKLKVGPAGILTRAGISIGVGLLGAKIKPVRDMAQGALTITLYNALRQYVTVPMNLGEISDNDMRELSALVDGGTYPALPGDDGMGVYEADTLGEYEVGDPDQDQYEMD